MVNHPRLKETADVTFLVGATRQPIQAHKLFLAGISDVFDKMFYSDFPSESIIKVEDIEPEIFEMVINFVYGQKPAITAENVKDVLYAAEKYNLVNLTTICSYFVTNTVTDNNVMAIFSNHSQFNNEVINKKCLAIIAENPLLYLTSEEFLKLNVDDVRSIAKLQKINCTTEDLKEAMLNWLRKNNMEYGEDVPDHAIDGLLKLTKLDLKGKKMTNTVDLFIDDNILVKIGNFTQNFNINSVNLYGIGVLLGKEKDGDDQITISIKIKNDKDNKRDLMIIKKNVHYADAQPTVQNFFFKKLPIKLAHNETLSVSVKFSRETYRSVFRGWDHEDKIISHLIYTDM